MQGKHTVTQQNFMGYTVISKGIHIIRSLHEDEKVRHAGLVTPDFPTQHICTPLSLTSGFRGNKSKDGGIKKQHSTSEAIVPCSALFNKLGKGQLGFPLLKKTIYISTSLISHLNMLSCICSCYIHLMFRSIFQRV